MELRQMEKRIFKKILCVITIPVLLLLTSCNNVQVLDESGFGFRVVDDFPTLNRQATQFLNFDYNENKLQLFNVITGEIEAMFELSSDQFFRSMHFLENGYYMISLLQGEDVDRIFHMPNYGDLEYIAKVFFILDNDLNIVEMLEISDIELIHTLTIASDRNVVLENGNDLLVYFNDAHRNIYSYNLRTNEKSLIYNEEELAELLDFNASIFRITPFNQIAFVSFSGNPSDSFYYGFINHNTQEAEIFSTDIFKPAPITRRFDIFGEYLIMHDREHDPEVLETKVLILDLLTAESRIIQILEYSFNEPVLINDGEFLAVFKTNWNQSTFSFEESGDVRLYDTQTSEIVFEHTLVDDGVLGEDEVILGSEVFKVDEGIYVFATKTAYRCSTTSTIDWSSLRFHHITIEIEFGGNE